MRSGSRQRVPEGQVGPAKVAQWSDSTARSSTTTSWLPVPRRPSESQVSMMRTSAAGTNAMRSTGSTPSDRSICVPTPIQELWRQLLVNGQRPVRR